MYKFKKKQLLVALTSFGPITPCLVITDNQDGYYVNCWSVGFRLNRHLNECGKFPVRLCFMEEELRIATFSDIIDNPFIYPKYKLTIKDFLKSLVE